MSRKMRVRPREERPSAGDTAAATASADDEVMMERQAKAYADAKHQEKEAESERKDIGGQLLPRMLDAGKKKIKVAFDEMTDATVSVKTRHRMDIDPERLKSKIGAKAFNRLTTPQLDETKIEAAIQLGDLDANDVAACTDESKTPYLECRFTKKRKRGSNG